MRGPNNIDWNNETWDAQRLVREFVSLKAWDFRGKTMEELVWSNQILFQRLIAVIHAYIGDTIHHTDIPFSYTSAVFSQSGYDNLETLQKSPIDKTDRKTILEWLFQWRDPAFQALWREEDFTWGKGERGHMISALLMQRFEVQRCLEVYDGGWYAAGPDSWPSTHANPYTIPISSKPTNKLIGSSRCSSALLSKDPSPSPN